MRVVRTPLSIHVRHLWDINPKSPFDVATSSFDGLVFGSLTLLHPDCISTRSSTTHSWFPPKNTPGNILLENS